MRAVKASGWLSTNLTDFEREILLHSGIIPINDAFYKYFHIHRRYEIYYGGRGSSKSHFVARKLLYQALTWPYFRFIYCRKHAVDIRESQFDLLKLVASDLGISNQFIFNDTHMKISCKKNGNTFIARGLDVAEKTKSISDPNGIWIEEPTELTKLDFITLNSGLRTQKGPLQTILTFNPVIDTNWICPFFFKAENKHELKEAFGDSILCRTTYLDNYFIDKKAYLSDLELMSSGNINFLRVSVEGDWGMTENESPWLYSFDREKHVRKVPFLPSYPVYLSFDFNNDPFACVASQHSENKGVESSFKHYIKEFVGEMKVEVMCAKILAAFPNSMFFITGDRSGKNEDIGRNQTLYQMIAGLLNCSNRQIHTPDSNLTHADSRLLCNAMFNNYERFYISPDCKNLIADCEKATIDVKTMTASALKKDRDQYKMDVFDAMRYDLQTYFNKFAKEKYFRIINKNK